VEEVVSAVVILVVVFVLLFVFICDTAFAVKDCTLGRCCAAASAFKCIIEDCAIAGWNIESVLNADEVKDINEIIIAIGSIIQEEKYISVRRKMLLCLIRKIFFHFGSDIHNSTLEYY
jgi:hypothetical protein